MCHLPLRRNALVLLGASALLTGCGLIGSWFPDKQKQYQFSSEIPPLEIPPDLTASTIEGATRGDRTPTGESAEELAKLDRPSESNPPKTAPPAENTPALEETAGNAPMIEIEAPFAVAWNDIARALGRLELEVTDQNRSDGLYYVYYGGDNKPYQDRGFFGDLVEMFGGGAEQAREYRVKVQDKGKTTAVYVTDPDGKPQTSGPGLELLKRLHETLQSLSEPSKTEPAT
ncbi:outer membrane protein assembly factor BamC [Candidatus Methylocalor cossyra]|uniref:Beta-barrel assembly machine subunit BamC n=1 Tax=Candidatus Methylocalor cossyra TaxID=3108543 RepID=A0ABM9NKU6_9GAMM